MSKIMPFFVGAAIGAGAALLLAPQAGEQTRAVVTEKANAFASEAKDFTARAQSDPRGTFGEMQQKGAAFVKDAQAKGQEFAESAQARVKEVSGKPAEVDADDLREKIEAARQRIAAQVMENAEQSKAVDVESAVEDVKAEVADIADTAKHAAQAAEEAAE